MTVYGAWSKRMGQWGKPVVHKSQVEMETLFLRDRDVWDHVKMLETSVRDHIEEYKSLPSILSSCFRIAPYDSLSILTWTRIWCENDKYEVKLRSGVEKAYFVG